MEIKQLSALLLVVSLGIVQPVGLVAVEEGTSKAHAELAKKSSKKVERKNKKSIKAKPGKSKKVAKKTPTKKKRKKKQKKTVKTTIAKQGKFNIKGGVKSFKESAEFLTNYMKTETKPTLQDIQSLWTSIARYYHYTEKVKAYKTKECNEIALKLFQEASQHKNLFSKSKMWLIEKWILQKRAFLSGKIEPEKKRFSSKGATAEKRAKVKKTEKQSQTDKLEKRRKEIRKDNAK